MAHDATKILIGSHGSSDLQASKEDVDSALFPAGRAVRRKNDGKLSLALADGQLTGVSLGSDLADTKKTAVARVGNRIPIELAAFLVKASLTFVAKRTVAVSIAFVAGGTAGSEVVTVTGDDVAGWLISVSMETTVSTATQLKAHLDASAPALALIETIIASGAGSTAQAAFTVAAVSGYAQAVIGAPVRISDVTGKAVPGAVGALSGAFYNSGALDGLDPFTNLVTMKMAYIDMVGGL